MRLANHVTVAHPETGARETFGPTDHVPDWARELIPNPKAWVDGEPLRSLAVVDDWSTEELGFADQTRRTLTKALERCGVEANRNASKNELIAQLNDFLFGDPATPEPTMIAFPENGDPDGEGIPPQPPPPDPATDPFFQEPKPLLTDGGDG